jgi:hypothetical protein
MKAKKLLFNILLQSGIAFATTVIVTLLWNMFIDNNGAIVDWKTSFLFAIIFPIVMNASGRKGN